LRRELQTKPSAIAEGVALAMVRGHDLVDTLSAQPEAVSNLGQGLPPKTSLPNLRISRFLATRSRSQWTPLPPGEHLQGTDTIQGKLSLSVTLPGVVDPVAEPKRPFADGLDMGCRDSAVALPDSELIQCTNMQEELFGVVHAVYNSDAACQTQPRARGSSENAKKCTTILHRRSCTLVISTYGGGKHG
jgi:hypothetical protein